MLIQPGIYDISNEEYHKPIGISRSMIMTFLKSPLHYWDKYINPDQPSNKSTVAKDFGQALHTYILEPQQFKNRYMIIKKINRTTKKGMEYWTRCQSIRGNLDLIYEEDFNKLIEIHNSIKNHSSALDLIRGGQYEQSIYWVEEETGLLCKSRIDVLHDNMVCDPKSAKSASLYDFQYAIREYGYHIQMAMTQDAISAVLNKKIDDFIFISIEKERPYAVGVYALAEEAIREGRKIYKQALRDIKKCQEENKWPSYPINVVSLPYLKVG